MSTFFSALGAGEIEQALRGASEDFVLDRRNSEAPWRGISSGRREAAAAIAAFRDAWAEGDGIAWRAERARAVGRQFAAIGTRVSVRGRASGIEVEARGGWMVRFEEELVAEAVLHQSYEDALLAARRRALDAARLYFVCEAQPHGRDPGELLGAAIAGGAEVIQMREKAPRCAEELVAFAEPFARSAREHGALFFLNDEAALVEACGADGVHVGQDDAPVADARTSAGPAALVGLSTHSPEQFDAALAARGASLPDQVSAGPVWETPTKQGRPAAGVELIEHASRHAGEGPPWFAIGGIEAANLGEVVAAGARRVVVVRAIRDAKDPESAARELRETLDGGRR